MYRTIDLELNNGKADDKRITLYIHCAITNLHWSIDLAYENNGTGLSWFNHGPNDRNCLDTRDWWREMARSAIYCMLEEEEEMPYDKVESFLSRAGGWMLGFGSEDFARDKWEEHTN